MTDINSSPVSLPAGGYDFDTLHKGLNAAAKGSAKNYDAAVDKALEEAGEIVAKEQDPRGIPGYKFATVENQFGGEEKIQVYDPKLDEKTEDDGAVSEADVVSNQAESRARGAAAAGDR